MSLRRLAIRPAVWIFIAAVVASSVQIGRLIGAREASDKAPPQAARVKPAGQPRRF